MSARNETADLVLEGGGSLGIAHVGALSAFEEYGFEFKRVAGASVGAIVAAFLVAGLKSAQLLELMHELIERRTFKDSGPLGRIPLLGPAGSLLFKSGLYRNDRLANWISDQLAKRGITTFESLRFHDAEAPGERRYRLIPVSVDLSKGKLLRLPMDYASYGLDPDKQRVAHALRASMSIPFYFRPFHFEYQKDGKAKKSVLADGVVLNNFPIDTFDRADQGPSPRPIFGVKLLPELPPSSYMNAVPFARFIGPARLLEQMLATMIVGQDRPYLDQQWVAERTVRIDTKGISPLDFRLEPATQKLLYDEGRRAALDFLAHRESVIVAAS
jgi:NTE family protein